MMFPKMANKHILKSLMFCMVAGLTLTGCASNPSMDTMSVQTIPNIRGHAQSVFVDVKYSGGLKPNNLVSRIFFEKGQPMILGSIQDSIKENSVFKQIFYGPGADYELVVTIGGLNEPAGEWVHDVTIGIEAEWTIYEATTRKIAMKETINSSYTALFKWHEVAYGAIPVAGWFIPIEDGGQRYRRAIAGAIRENILQGLMVTSKQGLN